MSNLPMHKPHHHKHKHHQHQNPVEELTCKPLDNLFEIAEFLHDPPPWRTLCKPLTPHSKFKIRNIENDTGHKREVLTEISENYCHFDPDADVPIRYDVTSLSLPKTLVCHDMANGYHDDSLIIGTVNYDAYTFYNWAGIDIFCYFSHHLITIPPVGWINVGHAHGVKVIGTIITEWNGSLFWDEILETPAKYQEFANSVVAIAKILKFDGWLLNIENKVNDPGKLIEFVKYLYKTLHAQLDDPVLVWYDSVTVTGTLNWQNGLTAKNRPFFDICDAFFTNYSWSVADIRNSVREAGSRVTDVYVGIDVWGRNFYGGGQFNVQEAIKIVHEFGCSLAIFAPAWTHEAMQEPTEAILGKRHKSTTFDTFYLRDRALWDSMWPFLNTNLPCLMPFQTSFCRGQGEKRWMLGEVLSPGPWYNLRHQQYQPNSAHGSHGYVLSPVDNTLRISWIEPDKGGIIKYRKTSQDKQSSSESSEEDDTNQILTPRGEQTSNTDPELNKKAEEIPNVKETVTTDETCKRNEISLAEATANTADKLKINEPAVNKDAVVQNKAAALQINDGVPQIKDAILQNKDAVPQIRDAIVQNKDAGPQIKDAVVQNKDAGSQIKDAVVRNKEAVLQIKDTVAQNQINRNTVENVEETPEAREIRKLREIREAQKRREEQARREEEETHENQQIHDESEESYVKLRSVLKDSSTHRLKTLLQNRDKENAPEVTIDAPERSESHTRHVPPPQKPAIKPARKRSFSEKIRTYFRQLFHGRRSKSEERLNRHSDDDDISMARGFALHREAVAGTSSELVEVKEQRGDTNLAPRVTETPEGRQVSVSINLKSVHSKTRWALTSVEMEAECLQLWLDDAFTGGACLHVSPADAIDTFHRSTRLFHCEFSCLDTLIVCIVTKQLPQFHDQSLNLRMRMENKFGEDLVVVLMARPTEIASKLSESSRGLLFSRPLNSERQEEFRELRDYLLLSEPGFYVPLENLYGWHVRYHVVRIPGSRVTSICCRTDHPQGGILLGHFGIAHRNQSPQETTLGTGVERGVTINNSKRKVQGSLMLS